MGADGNAHNGSADVAGSAQFAVGTLTTLHAATPPTMSTSTRSVVDSVLMRHFGDGPGSQHQVEGKGKEKEIVTECGSFGMGVGSESQSWNGQPVHSLPREQSLEAAV